MIEIIGIGASIMDTIFNLDQYPREDTKICATEMIFQCGGPAATGVVTAAKLGAQTAFLGIFSDDSGGRRMTEEFQKHGVCTDGVKMEKGGASPTAAVLTSRKNQSRTIIWNPGNVRNLEPEDIPKGMLAQAKLLHLDGHQEKAAVYAADEVKKHGGKVLLDAGSVYPGMENLVKRADILIASEEFSLAYTDTLSPEQGIRILWERYKPEVLVVTLGKRGGLYCKEGEILSYPAYNPPGGAVDTTGAGDVFHGAFAFGYLKGWNVDVCVRFASGVSALKCMKRGGRTGIPDLEQTLEFLKKQGLKIPV